MLFRTIVLAGLLLVNTGTLLFAADSAAPAAPADTVQPAVTTPEQPAAPADTTQPPAQEEAVSEGPTMKRIMEAKKIVVGLEPNYPPFEFKPTIRKIEGFDIDVASYIAKSLGIKLEIKEIAWDDLIPTLESDKIDVIISGMTKTPARANKVYFSDPYFSTGQVVVLNRKRKNIKSLTELNMPSTKIGVQKGTTGEQAAKDNFPKAKIKSYDDIYACQNDLINNKIDALVYDKPLVVEFIGVLQEKIFMPFEPFTTEEYCFAVNKGNIDFIKKLNEIIKEIKTNGTYDQIFKKWFSRNE